MLDIWKVGLMLFDYFKLNCFIMNNEVNLAGASQYSGKALAQ